MSKLKKPYLSFVAPTVTPAPVLELEKPKEPAKEAGYLCAFCFGEARVFHKGTSYCKECLTEKRRLGQA